MAESGNDVEARRLESLWKGDFGDDYVERNTAFEHRRAFWTDLSDRLHLTSVLEVGCNIGGNLRWLPADNGLVGVDVNQKALNRLRTEVPNARPIWCTARSLPVASSAFDLVFTMGVLIHQPEESLPEVMAEMVRCSSQWVLCGEYASTDTVEVPYRGVDGALFKRDYGEAFLELFPDLTMEDRGFLSRDDGWDDVTWWLMRKR